MNQKMTNEVALKEFQLLCDVNEHYGNGKNIELFTTAIKALEKSIPIKPLSAKRMWEIDPDIVVGGYGMYTSEDKWCPACHSHIIKDSDGNTYRKGYNTALQDVGYCFCGQKIDWRESL